MAKGSGWSVLGKWKGEASAPQPAVPPEPVPFAAAAPPPPAVNRADQTATALARLPRYFTTKDLLDAFGGADPLLDAYVLGHLPPLAVSTLEANYPQLHCWLLARVIRLAMEVR